MISRKHINNTLIYNEYKKIDINEFKQKYNQCLIVSINNNFGGIKDTNIKTKYKYKINVVIIDHTGNKRFFIITGLKLYLDIQNTNPVIDTEIEILINSLNVHRNTKNIQDSCIKMKNIYLKPFNEFSLEKLNYTRLICDEYGDYNFIYTSILKDNSYKNLKKMVRNNESPFSYYNKILHTEDLIKCSKIPKNSIIMTWDIETYNPDNDIPLGDKEIDQCFLICGTFHEYRSEKILKTFVISTIPLPEYGNKLIYNRMKNKNNIDIGDLCVKVCKSEKTLIKTFIELLQESNPDFILDFNGHSYDWIYLKNKICKFYKDLKPLMYDAVNFNKYNYGENEKLEVFVNKQTKIEMDNVNVVYPKSDSIIFIDVRTEFRKMVKDVKSSLNFYLKQYNLDLKEDLSYKELSRIYKEKDTEKIIDAIIYCIIDAFRCIQLLNKKSVINEYNTMSNMTNITLENAIRRANGFKVLHFLQKYGHGYSFNFDKSKNITTETKDYKGGYVADPIKGLNTDLPVIVFDFASLYPNIMIAYNLSPDMLSDIDLSDRKNNIIMKNINDKYVLDHMEDNNKKGLLIKILINLFNDRKSIKKQMNSLLKDKNIYIKNKITVNEYKYSVLLLLLLKINNYYDNNKINILKNIYEFMGITEMDYVIKDLDQKQYSIKILMNSFYGLLGSPNSELYNKFIAETITSKGRELLLTVRDFVQDKGYIAHYSDTDSVFVSCNKEHFKELEQEYYDNKISVEELYKNKIDYSYKHLMSLLSDINKHLIKIVEKTNIRMEYEKVLSPILFIKKKMYIGIQHGGDGCDHSKSIANSITNDVNINKLLYIKGYSIVRRTTTKLTTDCINDLFKTIFDIDIIEQFYKTGNVDVFEIIKRKIIDIVYKFKNNLFPIDYFIKNDKYTGKENIRVNKFVERMKKNMDDNVHNEELKIKYFPPDKGDRFDYVYVEKLNVISYDGKIIKTTGLSDIMEYPSYIADYNGKINYIQYFDSDLSGELGTLIDKDNNTSADSKKIMSKLFELLYNNYEDSIEYESIINLYYDDITIHNSNYRKKKLKELKIDSKNKSNDYIALIDDLFHKYPVLISYNFLNTPTLLIYNVINYVKNKNINEYINTKMEFLKLVQLYNNNPTDTHETPNLDFLIEKITQKIDELETQIDDNVILYRNDYSKYCNSEIEKIMESYITEENTTDNLNIINKLKDNIDNNTILQSLEDDINKYYILSLERKKMTDYNLYIRELKIKT